ncbi:MAG: nucleotidyltransferase domain-containing protein [Nanopusillaceae archaeon]
MDIENLSEETLKLVLDFGNEIINKVNGLIRMIILFGSHAKGKNEQSSDIDLLIVVDDVYNVWDNVTSVYYFDNLNKILSQEKFKKLHVNTLTLSIFWDMARNGDPLLINILRTGKAIIDPFGLFGSLKKLLEMGRIKPSEEAIEISKRKIDLNIRNYKLYLLKAFENVYGIFVTLAQYYLMKKGYLPPEPSEILEYLKKEIKDEEILEWYSRIFEKAKKISHGEIAEISTEELKEFYNKAIEFKNKIEKILNEGNISGGGV